MEAKLFVVLALVGMAQCAVLPQPGFSYEVGDPNIGDYKSHEESRVGDAVYGHYSVQEPDGSKRIVSYIADKEGFNAVVRKCPVGWARITDAAAPATELSMLCRSSTVTPGVPDSRVSPALYNGEPSEITSWPYGTSYFRQ